jgi:hypothetical protein
VILKNDIILAKLDSSKQLFTLMLVVIIAIIVDSQIGVIADFIPKQISSQSGVFLFILFAVLFAITQYFILIYVKQSNKETSRRSFRLRALHNGVTVAQYTLAAIIAIVIFQILLAQQYNTVSLFFSYAISYGLWIIILALLAKALFSWYGASNNNLTILLFALAMIAYVINGITGLATSFDMLTQQKSIVTYTDVASFPEFSIESIASQIWLVSQIASSSAYVLIWCGTAKLLYPYVKKLGKIKFWILMSVAMIYYLVAYPLFVLGYFSPSENVDAMINVIIFSFAGVMSGIIFGISFLSVARTLRKGSVLRNHMILAAYGFVLFYISGSAIASQAAYPPYGIVPVSFTGLSCYLIFAGLYSSAIIVSQDATLRLTIRKSLTEQAKFLDSMGSAQLERELQSTVMRITKKHSAILTEKTGVEASMTDSDIKEYMSMVMDEIRRS